MICHRKSHCCDFFTFHSKFNLNKQGYLLIDFYEILDHGCSCFSRRVKKPTEKCSVKFQDIEEESER
jgi:hypothetical protein